MSSGTSLLDRCGYCDSPENLAVGCSGCEVMFYCSDEHKAAHHDVHEDACKAVFWSRTRYNSSETRIRIFSRAFDDDVGRFWQAPETREYMETLVNLANALGAMGTKTGVEKKLDYFTELLRLDRGDNSEVYTLVPALMLRLNKDQACYDFVVWWYRAIAVRADWHQLNVQFLNLHNQNVLEKAAFLGLPYDLNHIAAVVFLKIKLLLDFERLRLSTRTVGLWLPREILDQIRLQIPASPIIARDRQLIERDDHKATVVMLHTQIRILFRRVWYESNTYWRLLAAGIMLEHPSGLGIGGKTQTAFAKASPSWDTCALWKENPVALKYLRIMIQYFSSTAIHGLYYNITRQL
ncbi:hypothetical protein BJX64DRAFT_285870 [Aspergillus heterothallicus]